MRIVVVGLGHIGVVIVAALLRDGHVVVGVDTDKDIRDCVGRGSSPFREPDVAELIASGHSAGRLSVTGSVGDALDADLVFVCVGTRSLANGDLDLSDVTTVARDLGAAAHRRSPNLAPLLIAFCSTMLPGSMRTIVLPAMVAAAGEPAGRRYEVVYHPEFIREGTAVADYSFPARIVVGERQPGSAGVLLDLFPGADVPTFMTSFEVAELTKFADNGFHALKVAFANEIGRFALCSGIPPADVFDIFRADTRLNLSASYLRPGGAFGGPCLPKDVRALAARMNEVGIAAPVIDHILASNASHTDFLIAEIERRAAPGSRILLVGLSFKAGTDDLRGSPLVRLAELLLDRGHDLAILDPDLPSDAAVGVQAQLSSRLAAKVLSGPPASTGWDLVVVGKHCPDILRSVDAKIFRIDQL